MVNAVQDLVTLTTLPKILLDKLVDKTNDIICHAVSENMLEFDTTSQIDIGIGTLAVKLEEDEIKYKFIPSAELEKLLKDTARTGKSPLINKCETALENKVMGVYKDLY